MMMGWEYRLGSGRMGARGTEGGIGGIDSVSWKQEKNLERTQPRILSCSKF